MPIRNDVVYGWLPPYARELPLFSKSPPMRGKPTWDGNVIKAPLRKLIKALDEPVRLLLCFSRDTLFGNES